MASRLDTPSSKIGPSAQARYARRAMRQLQRRGPEGLVAASKLAGDLAEMGEGDTIRSSEGRVAADALQRRYDDQIIREQESALSGPRIDSERPSSKVAQSTAGQPALLRDPSQAPQSPSQTSDLVARLPEPGVGVPKTPVNEVSGAAAPQNLGDFQARRINPLTGREIGAIPPAGGGEGPALPVAAPATRLINPLTGKPLGYVPDASDNRSLDDRLSDYQKKYLGGGDITTALRESSARNAMEAARLRSSSRAPAPSNRLIESAALVPPPDLPIDEEEPAFTPSAAPASPRPSLARTLGQVGQQALGNTFAVPAIRTGLGTAELNQRAGQAARASVRPIVDNTRRVIAGNRGLATVAGAGANALLDRVRRGGRALGDFRRGLTE